MDGRGQKDLALKPSEIQGTNVRTKVRTVCGECWQLYLISNLWIEAFARFAHAHARMQVFRLCLRFARAYCSRKGAVLPLVS